MCISSGRLGSSATSSGLYPGEIRDNTTCILRFLRLAGFKLRLPTSESVWEIILSTLAVLKHCKTFTNDAHGSFDETIPGIIFLGIL